MKKIIILFLYILFSASHAGAVYGTWNQTDLTLTVKNASGSTLATIQQISFDPDLVTATEIFNFTSYVDYTFNDMTDFKFRWQRFKGNSNITGVDLYYLKNVSYQIQIDEYGLVQKNQTIPNITYYEDVSAAWNANPWPLDIGSNDSLQKYNFSFTTGNITCNNCTAGLDYYQVLQPSPLKVKIFWNETGIIGSHQETRYQDEYTSFQLDGVTARAGKSYIVKAVLHKKAEMGDIAIQTIPSFLGVEAPQMSWWNSTWRYRIDNLIPNGTRPYQISLNISNSTGISNNTHVYCQGNCNLNFTDIRFTLNNASLLPYWVADNVTGKVYVNVTENGIINMYYGSSSANSLSNGTDTFILFDDGTSLSGWNSPHASWAVSGGLLRNTGSLSHFARKNININDYILEGLIQTPSSGSQYLFIYGRKYDTDIDNGQNVVGGLGGNNALYSIWKGDAWVTSGSAASIQTNSWYAVKLILNGANVDLYADTNQVEATTLRLSTNSATITSGATAGWVSEAVANHLYDNFRVRYFSSTEPRWTNWSGQYAQSIIEISNSTSEVFTRCLSDSDVITTWNVNGTIFSEHTDGSGCTSYTLVNNFGNFTGYNITNTWVDGNGTSHRITWLKEFSISYTTIAEQVIATIIESIRVIWWQ